MATRRPKVPRATPAAPKSPDTGDGGDVIQADFSGSRGSQTHPAGNAAPGPRTPGRAAGQHSGTAGSARAGGPASAAAPKNAAQPNAATPKNAAQPNAAKSGTAKHGTGTHGTAKHGTAKPSKDGAAPAAENLDPVPAKAFSGRMLALLVVMIAITIMLAPTVKIFFEKRAEIAALQADISDKQAQQDELRRQVSRWQDPNYVKQQARDRINMVMPGETGYWVFGSDLPAGSTSGAAGAGSAQDPAELPWVDSLWDSIRRSATD
ncbi:cell division protein FtsB [Pseudarthrobacter oxydans]|uniref:FtsB family cell division protein n=1 Tax=Pseudarthrobacter oxydans TaxID=1671 RepID=UPI002788DF37|nr:septum formation initiator family protein [Pseudarthrobacter oxydans]MDP9981614.1 cell division protein FtsB [Pseudarthrobacter oxydans]